MQLKQGDRIELISMQDDPCPIEPGTTGTVEYVNEVKGLGFVQIGVAWDNGRTLMLSCPPDTYRRLQEDRQ
jgi:hypothetical protein